MTDPTDNEDDDWVAENGIAAEIPSGLEEFPEEIRPKVVALIASFQGPLPPPWILKGYEEVIPGSAQQILDMATNQSKHRQAMERLVVNTAVKDQKAERSERRIGQFLGFGIGCITIVAGAILAGIGQPWAGSFIGGSGVVGLVSVFVKSMSIKNASESAMIDSVEDD